MTAAPEFRARLQSAAGLNNAMVELRLYCEGHELVISGQSPEFTVRAEPMDSLGAVQPLLLLVPELLPTLAATLEAILHEIRGAQAGEIGSTAQTTLDDEAWMAADGRSQ